MRWFSIASAVVGLVMVACGSGGEEQPTGTAASERVERQATVAQQRQEALDAEVEEQPVDEAEPQQQTAASEEEPQEQQVVELPTEIVGEHKGVRSERHVLGQRDAPVEIRYYGEFT